MTASATYDVVIIGGGVIGSAAAYFLSALPAFDGTVTIIERDTGFADTSTARSVGGIRQQFSSAVNVRLSQFAAGFVREAPKVLAVDGSEPFVPFVEQGYLMLADDAGHARLRANIATQHAAGAVTELLDPVALADRFPWLNTDGLAAGGFGPRDEGWTDPYALMQAFRKKAQSLGAELIQGEVTGLTLEGHRVVSVTLADGTSIGCGHVINAAGPRAATIAAMAGIDLPVRSRKRFVFVLDCRDEAVEAILKGPLTVDPCGIYFRPEGRHFICGRAPNATCDPDCGDLEIDHAFFEDHIWEGLANRVPAFEAVRVINAWAGHYAHNVIDQNALIGLHPAVSNLLFANGFSGHGLQQSPGVGRALSELIAFGAYRTLDLSDLGVERVLDGRRDVEANVV
ncbi:MAG: FAD-binding oxidoreductase [Rhodospirillales bacterium]